MLIIMIKIWKPRSITWQWKLCYSIFIVAFFLRKWDAYDVTALLKYLKDGIPLMYANNYKKWCYPVLRGFMVDYKEQVLIIDIKVNI